MSLYDGIPQTVYFSNFKDASKNLIFNVPEGDHMIMISLRSRTKGFFPSLFLALEQINDKGQYVKKTQSSIHPTWDREQYMLQVARRFKNVQADTQLKVSLHYQSTLYNASNWNAEGVDSSG